MMMMMRHWLGFQGSGSEVCVCVCGGGGGGGGQGLRVDLCGGGFLVDGLLPQIVAALVLLLHAVDEEEDEEDGEHQADGAACDQSWKRRTRARARLDNL